MYILVVSVTKLGTAINETVFLWRAAHVAASSDDKSDNVVGHDRDDKENSHALA